MAPSRFHTTRLRDWLDRLKAGDVSARDELVRAAQSRLEQLAQRMLQKFPNVRRWADTSDVFQGAVVRLLRALETVPVANTREFLNLAAAQVRRELLDLARHFYGPQGWGANYAGGGSAVRDAETQDTDGADLERWTAFHEAVEKLPAEEREVFGLTFYHGWTRQQVAELFGVDERTVRRRWRRACEALHEALRGALPE
jgi:RNA polymerase sigma-70 factor (ECF subfamily)